MNLQCLIVISFLVSICHYGSSTSFHEGEEHSVRIALVLPENTSLEIIHGAATAVEMINRDGSILLENNLELFICPTGMTALAEIFSIGRCHITALIGLFQVSEVQRYYPLAIDSRLNIPLLLSGSPNPRVFENDKYPDLFHLVQPATEIVRGMLQFLQSHNWNRLSVITDEQDYRNFDTAGQVRLLSQKYSSLAIKFYSITMLRDIKYHILHSPDSYISFVAMSSSNTLQVLCEAYLKGQIWPTFVWIIAYHRMEDIAAYTHHARGCDVETIVEGVIFIHQQLLSAENSAVLVSGLTYEQLVYDVYNSTFDSHHNPYRNILHDAIWATALALNASVREGNSTLDTNLLSSHLLKDALNGVSFSGASGPIQFSNSNRERLDGKTTIYQIINGSKLVFENDSLKSTHFENVGLNLASEPFRSPALFVLFYLNITTCFIFETVVLILYCYYRNKESIKSTSFSLSIMIFVGCYVLLLFLVFEGMFFLPQYESLKASVSYRLIECFVRIWFNALGIPSILIFATLLVKIARVYRIFFSQRKLKFSSNTALFFYVMVLMIPVVIILITWTLDTTFNGLIEDTVNTQNVSARLEIRRLESCIGSPKIFVWIGLLAVYFTILLVCLIVVALLTRKIRYKNFKDTKKVNVLVLLLIYTYTFTLSYWIIVQTLDMGEQETSRIVLHIGHLVIIVECIGLLFVPKVYPFLKEVVMSRFNDWFYKQ